MWHTSVKRSLLKSITYRIICTIETFIIAWVFTGRVWIASDIALPLVIIKIISFFVHERIWDHIRYGREE